MASRPSSEALLLSALVNCGDVALGATYGITPDMLEGYGVEYRWALSFADTYGHSPTKDVLLSRFADFPFTEATDVAFAADEVRQEHNQRLLRAAVRRAVLMISESDYRSAAEALAGYLPLSAVRPPQNALFDTSFLASYDERPDQMAVPWKTLQAVTGGIRPGDLWYLAARLGQGKSWTMLVMIADALLQGRRINVFSLEMPREQLLVRLHVVLGRLLGEQVDHKAMRDKVYDLIAYRKLVNRIRDEVPGEIYLYDSRDGKVSPATVAARAGDVDLNVIDYVGLMSDPLGTRAVADWRNMAGISNDLKQIAIAKSTRIVALSQINREGELSSRNSPYPPKVVNLSQSDALGQDGDVVLTHKQFSRSTQVYSIEKNRHGAAGLYFYTRFLPNEGAFHEISKDTASDLRDREDSAA